MKSKLVLFSLICIAPLFACADDSANTTDSTVAPSSGANASEQTAGVSAVRKLASGHSNLPPIYDETLHDAHIGVSASSTETIPIRFIARIAAKKYGVTVEEFYDVNPDWEKAKDEHVSQGVTVILGYFTDSWTRKTSDDQ